MRRSAFLGIVFANSGDSLTGKLTQARSMASVPFGGRYRLIDFAVSNLVNAGIGEIQVITKENYHSLMDHLGNGAYWDLNRKNGGLYLIPPYSTSDTRRYSGTVDALLGAENFISRNGAEYVVLYNCDSVANVDIASAIRAHLENRADITLVTAFGKPPQSDNTLALTLEGDRVTGAEIARGEQEAWFDLGICVVGREKLLKLVREADSQDLKSIKTDIVAKKTGALNVCAYRHETYAAVLDSLPAYFRANMSLLDCRVRKELFCKERAIFTKTRDDMPTRYGTKAKVTNSFVADGCVINGTVRNSILFRGVTVERDAVIENSILMDGAVVKQGASLNYVLADKHVSVGENVVISGTENSCFFMEKNQTI